MKIIISRKGFDAQNGKTASPIMPDGTMLSLPIPQFTDEDSFEDFNYNGKSYLEIWDDLKPNHDDEPYCHLDPDLRMDAKGETVEDWMPVFGQAEVAARHLENQGVEIGDIFMFFGWFRKTEEVDGKLRYVKDAPNVHALFGFLQVGYIAKEDELEDYWWHPHANYGGGTNTMYVASEKLIINGRDMGIPGAGTFKYSDKLVLTMPGMPKSMWKLPDFFRNVNISYHTKDSFKPEGYFQSARKGQEFVVSESPKVTKWAKDIIMKHIV